MPTLADLAFISNQVYNRANDVLVPTKSTYSKLINNKNNNIAYPSLVSKTWNKTFDSDCLAIINLFKFFYAAIYVTNDDTPIMAFRGTVASKADIGTSIENLLVEDRLIATQAPDFFVPTVLLANTFTRKYISQYKDIIFTGHSLGGYLAAECADAFDRPAYTFNAPGSFLGEIIPKRANVYDYRIGGSYGGDLVSFLTGPGLKTSETNLPSKCSATEIISCKHSMDTVQTQILNLPNAFDEVQILNYASESDANSKRKNQEEQLPPEIESQMYYNSGGLEWPRFDF